MEMFPNVQSVLKIPGGNPFPLGKAEKPGGWGTPPFHQLSDCADGGPCSLLLIPLGELGLGLLFPVTGSQKHLFSNLDHG